MFWFLASAFNRSLSTILSFWIVLVPLCIFPWLGSGNSLSGCALCLTATTLYSLVAIIVSSLDCEVTELLALEGLYSLAVLTALIFSTALGASGVAFGFTNLSDLSGSAGFLSMNDLMLNLGWLSCSKLMGASQTAMFACLSIPLSLLLDAMLLGAVPSTPEARAMWFRKLKSMIENNSLKCETRVNNN